MTSDNKSRPPRVDPSPDDLKRYHPKPYGADPPPPPYSSVRPPRQSDTIPSQPDPLPQAPPLRLLDQMREAIRARHYSIRTEATYVDWGRRFILFHSKRHPLQMGAAKSALLFLYRVVLDVQLPWLDDIVAAKDKRRLPVVLTPREVRSLLNELSGTLGLLAALLYGTGMRLLEGLRLRRSVVH